MTPTNLFHQRSVGSILLMSAVLFGAFIPIQGFAADVVLSWDEIRDGAVAGYVVHYGTASRMYSGTLATVPKDRVTVANGRASYKASFSANPGVTYYFTIMSYDSSGNKSGYSNEAQWKSPATSGNNAPAPPKSVNTRIITY